MIFKKTGIARPTDEQIAEMSAESSGLYYSIITDSTYGSVYYFPDGDYLFFYDKANSKDYHYYFADHATEAEGWYLVGGTETVTEDLGFDETNSTIYSLSYLTAITGSATITIKLTSTNKIRLKTAGKYCENDIIIVPYVEETSS